VLDWAIDAICHGRAAQRATGPGEFDEIMPKPIAPTTDITTAPDDCSDVLAEAGHRRWPSSSGKTTTTIKPHLLTKVRMKLMR
jgi:hypothetical protein